MNNRFCSKNDRKKSFILGQVIFSFEGSYFFFFSFEISLIRIFRAVYVILKRVLDFCNLRYVTTAHKYLRVSRRRRQLTDIFYLSSWIIHAKPAVTEFIVISYATRTPFLCLAYVFLSCISWITVTVYVWL